MDSETKKKKERGREGREDTWLSSPRFSSWNYYLRN